MAEAVVSIVINGLVPLGNLVIQQANFLSGVSDQIELAQSELLLMRSFLKDADTKQEDDEVVRFWVNLVREAAYDLEDVIESFVLKVAFRRGRGMKIAFKRFACICTEGVDRYKIGSEIESITTKLSKLRSTMQSYEIKQTKGGEGESSFSRQRERRQAYDHVTDDHDVVGLEKKVEDLADRLVKEKRHRIVSIWGMGGVGKTTLAKQVYNKHKSVKYHFECFAWVSVSQQCDATTVMKDIFIQLSGAGESEKQKEEIKNLKCKEIAKRLYNFQQKRKCLVVLDDIWTLDAWNSLKNGFPVNKETESRIILTTRIQEVAKETDFFYKSEPLNENESWDLFQKIAISKTDETDKEALGKEMLKHCGGLPLAIIVLAGLLARKDTYHEWVTVRENVDVYIRRGSDLEREYKGQNSGGASWVLDLSYQNLPYQLKLCFLYLSQFPEDYEIPVKRLTYMWIAKGFISTKSTEMMEDVAYSCLSELVERCMVQVGDIGLTGKIKTCRLHDLMRDLCTLKAKEESFIHIVNFMDKRTLAAPTRRVRRLAIHFDDESCNFTIPTRDFHLRSLLFFGPEFYEGDMKFGLRALFKDFGLLRVLKFEDMASCRKLPSTIGNLVHLRFLSLKWSRVEQLPSSVENLVCLQTLDLRQDCVRKTVKIPNVFNKMQHLRHLYLPVWTILVSEKLSLSRLSNLQTLVNIDIDDCDLNAFAELTNLRKLCIGARESTRMKKLEEILISRNITYKHLRSLSLGLYPNDPFDIPWEIVLRCRFIYKLSLRGTSTKLREALLSYAYLTKIQLDSTNLNEDQIQILEKLPKLKALQFVDKVFSSLTSNTLVCSSGGFLKLESLSFKRLDNLHEWRVERGAMPSLCRLHIRKCKKLKGVPDGLQFVTTLKEITIDEMESEFCNRLRESGEDFYRVRHVPSIMFIYIQDSNREEAERQRADAGMPEVVVEAEESIVTELNETTTGACINNHPLSMRPEQENEAETRGRGNFRWSGEMRRDRKEHQLAAEGSELVVAHEESTVDDEIAGPSRHTRSEHENEAEMELAAVSKVEESL